MNLDVSSELIKKMIEDRSPGLESSHVTALAEIWSWQASQIIRLVLRVVAVEVGICHEVFKDQATEELAKLMFSVMKLVVSKNLEGREPSQIDIQDEWQSARSGEGLGEREITALGLVRDYWKPLMKKWQASTHLLEHGRLSTLETIRSGPRIIIPGTAHKCHTIDTHYDPSFSNRYWTNDANKQMVKVFSRRVNGTIGAELRPSRKWGVEQHLYWRNLEDYFSIIESEIAKPDGVYSKLLEGKALMRQIDDHKWTVFLVVQMLRTPAFIIKNMTALKKWLESHPQFKYPTDSYHLRRVYEETLFGPNFCTNSLYREIFRRDWMVLKSADGHYFVKSDNPVTLVRNGPITGILYPLSPTKCFLAGFLPRSEKPTLRVKEISLTSKLTRGISAAIAYHADYSIMTCLENRDPELEVILERWLANHKLDEPFPYRLIAPYWVSIRRKGGPLSRSARRC